MNDTTTVDGPALGQGSDFARLSERIKRAGLLDARPFYYVCRIGLVAAAYAGAWLVFVFLGNSWAQTIVAVVMAVVFAQVALVAHDIAHRQVFRDRRRAQIAGMIAGNLGIGMSYGWWMDKHTRHHRSPNHPGEDPDVSANVLVWSVEQARASTGIARHIGKIQAYLFFPLLLLEGFHLHVASVRALTRGNMRRRGTEAALLAVHLLGYAAIVFATLPVGKALLFIAIHQGVFGLYLGCTFAPNHKGMLIPESKLDFLRKQVLTSRDVTGGRLLDVALGGLNHQIEHHLFPAMPSPNLRHAKPIVRDYCAEIGVPYHDADLVSSYRQALTHLHRAGAPLRNVKPRRRR